MIDVDMWYCDSLAEEVVVVGVLLRFVFDLKSFTVFWVFIKLKITDSNRDCTVCDKVSERCVYEIIVALVGKSVQ